MGKVITGIIAAILAVPLLVVVILGGDGGCVASGSAAAAGAVSAGQLEQVGDVPGLSGDPDTRDEQLANAAVIINTAKDLGLPLKAQAIGVMTALGESSLINVDHGDDVHGVTNPDGSPTCSLGLFQQQWCLGWGTREQVLDPAYAATKFFERLAQVAGWQDLEPTIAANKVQRNADPFHYAPYWETANAVVSALTGVTIDPAAVVTPAGSCTVAGAGGTGTGGAAGEPAAWGGFSNGQIPAAQLKPIPWAPGELLRTDAADALIALNNAYRAQFGTNIAITDSYRSYAEQVATKNAKGHLAATPGYSNHGWALALDLSGGINNYDTDTHRWMQSNAARFGWINPDWAQRGGRKEEPWHWEFWGAQTHDAA
ncbi:M15 family metallopeptidase [Puerhibacterium puerhi]|uniref:M15 family metallopeptidase n=1 Tax=Puerhibacterium puerhi TaxID=2692623 RepID=UPI0013576CD9|nr:M15 family metallopeptidase [Puerhibacterium puerhi]